MTMLVVGCTLQCVHVFPLCINVVCVPHDKPGLWTVERVDFSGTGRTFMGHPLGCTLFILATWQ